MEQGSAAWHQFRLKGIGSSDAPVVMKVSPWKTPYQLWEEKTQRAKDEKSNWAMRRGNNLEPKARTHYELSTDIDMPADLAIHPKYEFLRASLDGFNREHKRILEVKCPGAEDHAKAVAGQVPEKYVFQIQHQLMVTGAEVADYYSFDGTTAALVQVVPNKELMALLLESEIQFWNLVQKDLPPELIDKDFKKIADVETKKLVASWKAHKEQIEELNARIEKVRADIMAKVDVPRAIVDDVQIMQVTRKGSVDYGKIPALKDLDLDQYRKKPTTSTVFTIKKSKSESAS